MNKITNTHENQNNMLNFPCAKVVSEKMRQPSIGDTRSSAFVRNTDQLVASLEELISNTMHTIFSSNKIYVNYLFSKHMQIHRIITR